MADQRTPRGPLERLEAILKQGHGRGLRRLDPRHLAELPHLYRFASSELARVETQAGDRARAAYLKRLVGRSHALLYRDLDGGDQPLLRRVAQLLFVDSPAAIRREWRLLATVACAFYGLATLAYIGVSRDLELAFALQSPEAVAHQMRQLSETEPGEPFRGNFTFEASKSPFASGAIMANNIWVSVLFFGSALVPPLFLFVLAGNSLMVGTYLGVAGHWGQAGAIASILFCHGTIELQMILLAGAAGLVLARGVIAPGPWSRRHALRLESRTAWCLFAPIFPLLVISGFIEGYVSPHAALPVRLATALGTGVLLTLWVLAGRARSARPGSRATALVEPGSE